MNLRPRIATEKDVFLYFRWANDKLTRQNSFQSKPIDFDTHEQWFLAKVKDTNALLLVFENSAGIPVGQVRLEHKTDENVIGISIDERFRGKGFTTEMLAYSCEKFFNKFQEESQVLAYIKPENLASIKAFENVGFELFKKEDTRYIYEMKNLLQP
jgi:[ribosomal protein S5]-alanine N-acetyltransferase